VAHDQAERVRRRGAGDLTGQAGDDVEARRFGPRLLGDQTAA